MRKQRTVYKNNSVRKTPKKQNKKKKRIQTMSRWSPIDEKLQNIANIINATYVPL